jgi:hypothetical protein
MKKHGEGPDPGAFTVVRSKVSPLAIRHNESPETEAEETHAAQCPGCVVVVWPVSVVVVGTVVVV